MVKYNTTFEFNLKDIDLIETALRAMQTQENDAPIDAKCINDILGKLHNQKTFYRPSDEPYVSG